MQVMEGRTGRQKEGAQGGKERQDDEEDRG